MQTCRDFLYKFWKRGVFIWKLFIYGRSETSIDSTRQTASLNLIFRNIRFLLNQPDAFTNNVVKFLSLSKPFAYIMHNVGEKSSISEILAKEAGKSGKEDRHTLCWQIFSHFGEISIPVETVYCTAHCTYM